MFAIHALNTHIKASTSIGQDILTSIQGKHVEETHANLQ